MTTIRPEQADDAAAVRNVNERAFPASIEADIVDALRVSCPNRLSLVAVDEGRPAYAEAEAFIERAGGSAGGRPGAIPGTVELSPIQPRTGRGNRKRRARCPVACATVARPSAMYPTWDPFADDFTAGLHALQEYATREGHMGPA